MAINSMQSVKYIFLLLIFLFMDVTYVHAISPRQRFNLHSQTKTDTCKSKTIHRISLEVHPSYVIPTHKFLRGKNSHHEAIRFAISGDLKYAFHFKDGTKFNRMYPHAYQGIGISYGSFINAPELGNPLGVYIFQGSRIKQFNEKLTLDYEWSFGVTVGWHEYDPLENRFNHVIGTNTDAYMNLGVMLNYQLNSQYHFTAGVSLSHFSNANTHYPNQGVNILESKLGIVRTFGEVNKNGPFNPTTSPSIRIPRHLSYDLVLYGAFRVREINRDDKKYIPDHEFGVCGINFNPMYHFTNNLSAGGSIDLQYDASSNLDKHVAEIEGSHIEFHKQPFKERISAGFSVRGEWAMPIFAINAGIGYNFYAKSFDTQKFYQILAMKIFLARKFFLHIGYQMNQFKDPNNLMLGLGYRFH